MKAPLPKQFLPLKGKPIAHYGLETLAHCQKISQVIIVSDQPFPSPNSTPISYAPPGERRQDSLYNALQLVSASTDLVCVHDAARPLLDPFDLEQVIEAAILYGAAALGSPIKNSIKKSTPDGWISHGVDRSDLWEVYTPQVVAPSALKRALEYALDNSLTVTDETSLLELIGHPVKLVCGSPHNIKITVPEDLALAESLLLQRGESCAL